jgi:flagellar biosynthesis GTPase FlhF
VQIQTYQATTMVELLAKVRGELGPFAVLLSVRRIPVEGAEGSAPVYLLEATAVAEPTPSTPSAAPESRQPHPTPTTRVPARSPGFGTTPAKAAAGSASAGTQVLVLVGPEGAGKTMMAAKVAAFLHAHSGQPLGLLSSAAANAASERALRGYAHQLRIPWAAARSASGMRELLERWNRRGPVVIDTGASPRAVEGLLGWLRREGSVCEPHLVLNATLPPFSIARGLRDYGPLAARKAMLTRMEDRQDAAAGLTKLIAEGWEVSFLGTGEQVPKDLERPTPARMAEILA